jgi:hypothetical protein
VQLRWLSVTFPRLMVQITPIVAALALFLSAIRPGERYHDCGSPMINAAMAVIMLVIGFPLARSVARDFPSYR